MGNESHRSFSQDESRNKYTPCGSQLLVSMSFSLLSLFLCVFSRCFFALLLPPSSLYTIELIILLINFQGLLRSTVVRVREAEAVIIIFVLSFSLFLRFSCLFTQDIYTGGSHCLLTACLFFLLSQLITLLIVHSRDLWRQEERREEGQKKEKKRRKAAYLHLVMCNSHSSWQSGIQKEKERKSERESLGPMMSSIAWKRMFSSMFSVRNSNLPLQPVVYSPVSRCWIRVTHQKFRNAYRQRGERKMLRGNDSEISRNDGSKHFIHLAQSKRWFIWGIHF